MPNTKTRKSHEHKPACYNREGIPTCGKMTAKERTRYEDLVDSADAARAIRDVAEGRDRIVEGAELNRHFVAMGLGPL